MGFFRKNKTQDSTVSVAMGADTAMVASMDGPLEEELPPRVKAVELSGKPGERALDTISECRACALHFASEILNGSMGLTMPIPQSQIKQLKLVKDVLMYLADECARQRGTKKRRSKASAESWLEWEFELLDATFMILSKAFLKPDPGFWSRVHKLALPMVFAKTKQRSAEQRFFLRKTEKTLTLVEQYRVLVLCGLANPQQLSEGDLLLVRQLAVVFVDDVEIITPKTRSKNKAGKRVRFRIEPHVDAPGKAFKEKPDENIKPTGNEIFIDTSKSVIQIGTALKAVSDGEEHGLTGLRKARPETLKVLMKRLLTAWGKKQVRRAERMRSGLDISVMFSVERSHEMMTKVQELHRREELTDLERLPLVADLIKESNTAEIIDESETGMRLRIKAEGVAARAGDLVTAVSRFGKHYVFLPGEIRWVENRSKDEFDIGVLKLGKHMAAVTILPDDYYDEFEEGIPAFIARSIKEDDKHWRLVSASGALKETHDYLVDVGFDRHILSRLKSVADTKQIDAFRCVLTVTDEPVGTPRRTPEPEPEIEEAEPKAKSKGMGLLKGKMKKSKKAGDDADFHEDFDDGMGLSSGDDLDLSGGGDDDDDFDLDNIKFG